MQTAAAVCAHQNLYASSSPPGLLFFLADRLTEKSTRKRRQEEFQRLFVHRVALPAQAFGTSGQIHWTGPEPPPHPVATTGPMHCSSLMHAVVPMMHFSHPSNLVLLLLSSSPPRKWNSIEKQSIRCARKQKKERQAHTRCTTCR